jgi:CRISPR-associated endonuclease/helicase Cas3
MSDPRPSPPPVAGDFSAFYRDIHGVDPFSWQANLANRVLADGPWLDLVDVPTGLGKDVDDRHSIADATCG